MTKEYDNRTICISCTGTDLDLTYWPTIFKGFQDITRNSNSENWYVENWKSIVGAASISCTITPSFSFGGFARTRKCLSLMLMISGVDSDAMYADICDFIENYVRDCLGTMNVIV